MLKNEAYCRFGHSLLQGHSEKFDPLTLQRKSQFALHLGIRNVTEYEADNGKGMEELMAGLMMQPSRNADNYGSLRTQAPDTSDTPLPKAGGRSRNAGNPAETTESPLPSGVAPAPLSPGGSLPKRSWDPPERSRKLKCSGFD